MIAQLGLSSPRLSAMYSASIAARKLLAEKIIADGWNTGLIAPSPHPTATCDNRSRHSVSPRDRIVLIIVSCLGGVSLRISFSCVASAGGTVSGDKLFA